MTVYLGRPGALVALPAPRRGAKPGLARQAGVRTTIGGGRAVDYAPGVLRTYTLEWEALERTTYGIVEAFFAGHMGPGPFALLDPARSRNLLTVNQSSATSALGSAAGFTATGAGEALASSSLNVRRAGAPRALTWSLPAAPAGGVLQVDAPAPGWYGYPVVPGSAYRWSVNLAGGGSDQAVDVAPALVWLDASGGVLSTTVGAAATTLPGAYLAARPAVQAAAPAGAAYGRPELRVTSASVGVGGTVIFIDELQLAMPSAVDDGTVWGPGLGVPRVSLPALDVEYLWAHIHKSGLTLTEVA